MILKKPSVFPTLVLACLAVWMIWPPSSASHITTTNTVLFDREIVGILEAHCVGCHAADSLAAPLETYEQVWLARGRVLTDVLARHMPPWAAVRGYGRFSNDNGLTLRETHFLVSWVEGLGPRNDGAVFLNVRDPGDPPEPVRAGRHVSEWVLGPPDVTSRLPATTVEPGQGERLERIVWDPGVDSEVWVRALEYMPGDRRVVRAATFRLASTRQWLGTWTPWHGFVELPEGVAYRLPAGARIEAEIYYGTASEAIVDQGTLGFHLAGESEGVLPASDVVLEAAGPVPPGAMRERFEASRLIESETRLVALWPQFEAGISSIEVSVRRPDGGTEVLLFARDIPIEYPTPYIFAEPVLVESGSRLRVVAYYANASDQPEPGGIRVTASRYE